MNTSSKRLAQAVILRPAVGRRTSRDVWNSHTGAWLFDQKFWAEKSGPGNEVPNIAGGSSANRGPQNDSY